MIFFFSQKLLQWLAWRSCEEMLSIMIVFSPVRNRCGCWLEEETAINYDTFNFLVLNYIIMLTGIHTIPDSWPWINNYLTQWSERIFRFNWVTLPFNWSGEKSVKQLRTTPLISRQGKTWQHTCIEVRHTKKLWIEDTKNCYESRTSFQSGTPTVVGSSKNKNCH